MVELVKFVVQYMRDNKIDIPIYQNFLKIRFLGTSSIISQYLLYRVAQKTVLSGYNMVIKMFINLKSVVL